MKRFLYLGLISVLAALAVNPMPASANTDRVTITNESNRCAWFTVYMADGIKPWDISWVPDGRPRALEPRQSHNFSAGNHTQVKIRAEVKKTGCSGDNVADTYDIRKDDSRTGIKYTAHLVNHNGGYQLWFH